MEKDEIKKGMTLEWVSPTSKWFKRKVHVLNTNRAWIEVSYNREDGTHMRTWVPPKSLRKLP